VPAGTTDYYEILGVERSATDAEIKKAFRRRARELHPDVNPAPDAEDRFKELNEAYDVLSDASKRDQYDRYGSVGRGAGAPGGYGGGWPGAAGADFGGFNMEDLFSAFFGGAYGGRGQTVRREGRDMVMAMPITLEEAAAGAEKDIAINRLASCDVCKGTGAAEGGTVQTCPDCNGTGQRVTMRQTFLGTMRGVAPCERCGQTGQVIDTPCEECAGSGRVPDRETIHVSIPAGIPDGGHVRISGKGEAGIRGATTGDLIVTVRVSPHDFYVRDGSDLHAHAKVSITQAALGAEIHVPGILGEDTIVHVHPGVQPGDVVRVKGEGMPRQGGRSRGDLHVHVDIAVPKKLTKRQRELLTELSAELGHTTGSERTPLEKIRDLFGV